MTPPRTFWFPVKRYGWGWGLPVCWQGWVVFASYYSLVVVGILYFMPKQNVLALFSYIVGVTLLLVVIVAWKGERPLAWRWGGR